MLPHLTYFLYSGSSNQTGILMISTSSPAYSSQVRSQIFSEKQSGSEHELATALMEEMGWGEVRVEGQRLLEKEKCPG